MIENPAAATYLQLVAEAVECEIEMARLRHAQVVVLAELNTRGTPGKLGYRGLPELIMAQLGCSPAEALELAQAAEQHAARRTEQAAGNIRRLFGVEHRLDHPASPAGGPAVVVDQLTGLETGPVAEHLPHRL